jgi:ribosomal protein S18 acetylase RimI-like enzyme
MAGSTSTILVARDDPGSLLGTAMVGHDGHRGWVYYLAVQPSHQRQGVARALMSACEDTWE